MTKNAEIKLHLDINDVYGTIIFWTHNGQPDGGFVIDSYRLAFQPRRLTIAHLAGNILVHGSVAPSPGSGDRIGVALVNSADNLKCALNSFKKGKNPMQG